MEGRPSWAQMHSVHPVGTGLREAAFVIVPSPSPRATVPSAAPSSSLCKGWLAILACLSPPGWRKGGPPPSWDVPHWLENFRPGGTPSIFPRLGCRGPGRGPVSSAGSELEPTYLTPVQPPVPTPPVSNTKGPSRFWKNPPLEVKGGGGHSRPSFPFLKL